MGEEGRGDRRQAGCEGVGNGEEGGQKEGGGVEGATRGQPGSAGAGRGEALILATCRNFLPSSSRAHLFI